MPENKYDKQIYKKINMLDESLKYLFDVLAEMKSGLETISYMTYLSINEREKDADV